MKWFPSIREALAELPWLGEGEIIYVGPGRPGRAYRVVRTPKGRALARLGSAAEPPDAYRPGAADPSGTRWVRAGKGKARKDK